MRLKNTRNHYGLISVLLHWLFALAIFTLLGSGLYMVSLTYYHPWYHPLPHYHKLLGIFTIGLFLIRTAWHIFQPQPVLDTDKSWEKIAAKATHYTMLFLSAGILFSGYLMISVDTTSVTWFGLSLPVIKLDLQNQADLAGFWHEYLAYGLIGFIGLHIAATLKHQFIDKKKLIQKIFGH